ncbi:M28 family peptidase [Fodinibius sp.]|uniref:M28 family peptidase n=1 Tax=Fodinibius sp. TaxID=1872440 RepID=UPI002ACD5B6D|nr:M28 family peptidase [Fodinibius sp.]MDZ7660626.1 M28 family peptidase [Fodinibius sp.]
MKTINHRIVLGVVLVLSVWLSFYVISPPSPNPETSPDTEFSAERAFKHIEALAQTPRPLGTAANDSARSYILDELRQLGLEPTIQSGIGIGSSFDRGLVGNTNNIIAKMNGANPQRTILLMAHYDSKPNTYGAGDDASGVAAILESLRAIKSQQNTLQNNVWILMTDGEERGLLGAELFTDEFEELQEIDLVLNFESRGSSGPSMMFETSENNGHLIPHFAQATPYPVANSLMYTVYKLLPNDTDMSVTKRAGLDGLNFAFTKDFLHYHTMLDTPENLSLASVQHHGSNLLSNVRHFGNTNFAQQSETEFVYFNNVTGGLLYYPSGWSFPLALVTGLLFITFLIYLFRTKQITIGRYLGSLLLFLITVTIGALITYFGWQGLKALHPQYQWIIQGEVYNHAWYFWGFTLLNAGLFIGIYGWIQNKLSTQQLISGPFTIWILLSLITAWYLPTASYIFTWPALMGLAGWIILGDDLTNYSWKHTAVLAVAFFWGLFIISPYIRLVQIMLTTEMLAVSMVVLILLIGLMWPLVWSIIKNHQYKWSGGILTLSLICMIAASLTSDFDHNHKKQNSINFVQNLDTDTAYWISREPSTDAWTQQFLSDDYSRGAPADISLSLGSNALYKKTTSLDIPQPEFEILSDSSSDSQRFLTLKMNAKKGIAMKMNWNNSSPITEIAIEGKPIFDDQDMGRYLYYFHDFTKAVHINLSYQNSGSAPLLDFTFVDPGLPTNLVENYQPRPDHMIPAPYSVLSSDATIWEKRVTVDTLRNHSVSD